jgi:hypothetical protein
MASTIEMQAAPEFEELEWKFALARAIHSQRQPATVSMTDDRSTPATIPPERLRLASADIHDLSAMIRQLVELRQEEESDEYGTLRASQHAFDVACHLLTDAAIISALKGRPLPLGCASTDSEGGVRVEWVRPTSSVHLAVPASDDRESYIYHEVGDDYGTVAATPEMLAQWLGEIA